MSVGRVRSQFASTLGVAVALASWSVLAGIIPADPGATDPGHRIGVAGAALLPAVAVLNLMIVTQMALRMRTGAIDPLAGGEGVILRVNQRALTNTVEQLAGFVPAFLALAAAAPPAWMPSVIAAGLVFALARLAFWFGYLCGPLLRAPGMAATFTINLATLIAALWAWCP